MLVDKTMLENTRNCTITEGQTHKARWSISVVTLEAYFALEYAGRIYGKE